MQVYLMELLLIIILLGWKFIHSQSFTKLNIPYMAQYRKTMKSCHSFYYYYSTRFNRVTALEREEKKKQEKREKKDNDQEEVRPVTIIKYTLGLKHQVRFSWS